MRRVLRGASLVLCVMFVSAAVPVWLLSAAPAAKAGLVSAACSGGGFGLWGEARALGDRLDHVGVPLLAQVIGSIAAAENSLQENFPGCYTDDVRGGLEGAKSDLQSALDKYKEGNEEIGRAPNLANTVAVAGACYAPTIIYHAGTWLYLTHEAATETMATAVEKGLMQKAALEFARAAQAKVAAAATGALNATINAASQRIELAEGAYRQGLLTKEMLAANTTDAQALIGSANANFTQAVNSASDSAIDEFSDIWDAKFAHHTKMMKAGETMRAATGTYTLPEVPSPTTNIASGGWRARLSKVGSFLKHHYFSIVLFVIFETASFLMDYAHASAAYDRFSESAHLLESGSEKLVAACGSVMTNAEGMLLATENYDVSSIRVQEVAGTGATDDASMARGMLNGARGSLENVTPPLIRATAVLAGQLHRADLGDLGESLGVLLILGQLVDLVTNRGAEDAYESGSHTSTQGAVILMADAPSGAEAVTPAAAQAYGFAKRAVDTTRQGISTALSEIRGEREDAAGRLAALHYDDVEAFTRSKVTAFEDAHESIAGTPADVVVKFGELFGGFPPDMYSAMARTLSRVDELAHGAGERAAEASGYEITSASGRCLADAAEMVIGTRSALRAISTGCETLESDIASYVGGAVHLLEEGVELVEVRARELSEPGASAADEYIASARARLGDATSEMSSGKAFCYAVSGIHDVIQALTIKKVCDGSVSVGELANATSVAYDNVASTCSTAAADGIDMADERVMLDVAESTIARLGGESEGVAAVELYGRALRVLRAVVDVLDVKVQKRITDVELAYSKAEGVIESSGNLVEALLSRDVPPSASSLGYKVGEWGAVVESYEQYILREGGNFEVDSHRALGHTGDMLRDLIAIANGYEEWIAANASSISPILDDSTTINTYYPQGVTANEPRRVVTVIETSNPYDIPLDIHTVFIPAPAGYTIVSVKDSGGRSVGHSAEYGGVAVDVPLGLVREPGRRAVTVVYDAVLVLATCTSTVQADDVADGDVLFLSNFEVTSQVDVGDQALGLSIPSDTIKYLSTAAADNRGNLLDVRVLGVDGGSTLLSVVVPSLSAAEKRHVFVFFVEPGARLVCRGESTDASDEGVNVHALSLLAKNPSSMTLSPVRLYCFVGDPNATDVALVSDSGDITVIDICTAENENAGTHVTFEVGNMPPGASHSYILSYSTSDEGPMEEYLMYMVDYLRAKINLAIQHAANAGVSLDYSQALSRVDVAIADAKLDVELGRHTRAVSALRAIATELESIFSDADDAAGAYASVVRFADDLGEVVGEAERLAASIAADNPTVADGLNAAASSARDSTAVAMVDARGSRAASALTALTSAMSNVAQAYNSARLELASTMIAWTGTLNSKVDDLLSKVRLIGRCGGGGADEAIKIGTAKEDMMYASSCALGGRLADAVAKLSRIDHDIAGIEEQLRRKSRTIGEAAGADLLAKLDAAAVAIREALLLADTMDRSQRVSAGVRGALLSTRKADAISGVEADLYSLERAAAICAATAPALQARYAWLEGLQGSLRSRLAEEDYWAVLEMYDSNLADVACARHEAEGEVALSRAGVTQARDVAADQLHTARAAIDRARPALGARERAALEGMYGELVRKFDAPPQAYADIAVEAADLAFFAEDLAVGRATLPALPAEGVPMEILVIVATLAALGAVAALVGRGKIRARRRPRGEVPGSEVEQEAPAPQPI